MFISLLQRQVIQLLPWYSRATRQQIENYPNQEIIQILATLVRTEEEYLQHRKEQRERLSTMNTDKNSINSSIDIWVIQIEAMQEDREDKEAVLGITQGKIENIRANMLDIVAACSETIDSRIADKQAELTAIQAELQILEQGRTDQIAEACAEQTSELKGLTRELGHQKADLEDRETELLAKHQMIKAYEAKGNAGNFVY